jgi:Ca2+-binding RTX toxin-like protein
MATIIGTPGSDFLVGTKDADLILGLAGNDIILGLEGNDSLFGNEDSDFIYGGLDNDLINGNQGNDFLYGNQGNDTIYGGMGNDEIRGGQDNDLLFGDKGNDTIFGDKGNDSIFGGLGFDLLYGNEGNDLIHGNEDADSIFGGQGNDLVFGGQGDDLIVGNSDNDTLFGNKGKDTIYGGADNDWLNGNEDDDFLNGNAGLDTIFGGQGNDLIFGGKDNDLLFGNKGKDTIFGNLGDDIIFGNEEDDFLNGNEGRDTIYGGQGNDSIFGGKDDDLLYGDKGSDTVFGNLGDDSIFGGEDADLLFGNEGDDFINGNQGDDTIYGGQGDDIIRGGMGNDRLFGDKGSDTIYGDIGSDTMTGDSGGEVNTDIFVVGLTGNPMAKTTGGVTIANADVITDWQNCIDKISLTGGLSYEDVVVTQGTGANAADTVVSIAPTFKGDGAGEFLVILQNTKADSIDGTAFIDSNGKLGPARATIKATDATATEPITTPTGILRDIGEFTVFINCPAEEDLPISYKVTGTATPGLDFDLLTGVVIIPKGSNKAIIPVNPLEDNLTEPPETVIVTLDTKGTGFFAGDLKTATVTIFDAVPVTDRPLVFVTAPDPTAFEQESKTGTFQFSRTGSDISKPLDIKYSVTGTATPGEDYNPVLTGTITIPAGQTVSGLINITPVADAINEPTETVVVSIAQDTNYFVGSQSTATISILDNNPLITPVGVTQPVRRFDQNGAFEGGFNNITEAVNGATEKDIIVVQPGTYNEPGTVLINQSLTLRGPNAGLSPTSGLTANPAIVSAPTNQPVITINPGKNVTIEGLRIEMSGDNSNAIRYQSNIPGNVVEIRQNEFTGAGPATGGVIFVDFTDAANSSARIIDNLIRDVTSGSVTSGIQAFRVGKATITNNLVANLTGPGILADTTQTGTRIIANKVSNTGQQGIQLAGGSATIANNDITNVNKSNAVDRGGIRLRESEISGANLSTADVFSNIVTNSFNAISIRNGSNITGTVTINTNSFIGNQNAGLYHGGTGTIDAKNNWWDDPLGPVVGGTGRNAIAGPGAGSVLFEPFSPTPF